MGHQSSIQTKKGEGTRSGKGAIAQPHVNIGSLHPLLKLQRQIGNRAVAHQIQAKMTVGKPNDVYEQEADRVAHTVMRMPDLPLQRQPEEKKDEHAQAVSLQRQPDEKKDDQVQAKLAIGAITPLVQRALEDEKAQMLQRAPEDEKAQMLQRAPEDEKAQTLQQAPEEKDEKAQMLQMAPEDEAQAKGATDVSPQVAPQVEGRIQSMRGGGQALRGETRDFFESRMGYDFSGVRIHADSQAGEVAGHLNAQAFAIGQNIFFNTGRYEPQTSQGKWLLAHELTHTVQQNPGASLVAPRKRVEPQTTGETTTNQEPPAVATTKTVGDSPASTPISAGTDVVAEPTGKADAKASTPAKESPELIADSEEAAASVKTAPKSPKEDPEFGKVMGQIHQTKKAQKTHQKPEVKNQAVADAAHLSEKDQDEYNARKQHLEIISKTANNNKDASKQFTAEQFKSLLKGQLDELEKKLPHSEAGAEKFKKEKPLERIKEKFKQYVNDENQKVAAPIATETRAVEPPKSSITPQTPKPLVEEKAGTKPKPINPSAAAPKPKADPEISMEKESRSLDELMEKNGNTEQQFAESNEPKFQQALKTKKDAQAKAAAAPAEYRSKEQQLIASAQKESLKDANASFGFMHTARNNSFQVVFQRQTDHDKNDKTEQQRIKIQLDGIYNDTKNDADKIFKDLSTFVNETFENESSAAKTTFEERVEVQLDEIHGLGIQDFLFGEDTEAIEGVFEREKKIFLDAMDLTLNTIAQRIADDLNKAVKRIKDGKATAEDFYKGLSGKQKELADGSMVAYRVQFENLESSVDEKQTELAQSLATSYKQNVGSLRKTFDKIDEDVKKTWIERAAEFVKEVATTIYNLGKLLVTVLVRIASVIGDILAHPIRFLENLAAGIKQGFDTFIGDFDGYLLSGFFDWLRGKVGGTAIKLPDKFDTAGLFSLALQVIGLTYDNFHSIAVEKLGEPVVAAFEKGVEGAEEVYKFLQLARGDIGSLWEHIKEVLASTVDEIFEKIKQTVLYETIKKVLTYIVTLFNPAGAFIKAAQAIYAGIRFLMDNMERIAALVNAFLDGVELAVKGDVSGIAAKVIFGLQNAIVLGIDFLAKLLNLGDLAEKARSIIKQLSAPVKRAMGFVVDKVLKPMVKAAGKLLGFGKDKKDPKEQQERLNQALTAAQAAVNRFAGKRVGSLVLKPLLGAIRLRYRLTSLTVVPDGNIWAVEGAINPRDKKATEAKTPEGTTDATATGSASTPPISVGLNIRKRKDERWHHGTVTDIRLEADGKKRVYMVFLASNRGRGQSSPGEETVLLEQITRDLSIAPDSLPEGGFAEDTAIPEHDKFKPKKLLVARFEDGGTKIKYETYGGAQFEGLISPDKMTQSIAGTKLKLKGQVGVEGRGITEDAPGFIGRANLNRSHLIADRFLGSGYKQGANLIVTSDTYNQEDMRHEEDQIVDLIKTHEATEFRLEVTARFGELKKSEIISEILSKTPEEEIDGVKASIETFASKFPNFKVCLEVQYLVCLISGKTNDKIQVSLKIGPDKYLRL